MKIFAKGESVRRANCKCTIGDLNSRWTSGRSTIWRRPRDSLPIEGLEGADSGQSLRAKHRRGRNYVKRWNRVGNRESRTAELRRSLTRNLNYSLRENVSTSIVSSKPRRAFARRFSRLCWLCRKQWLIPPPLPLHPRPRDIVADRSPCTKKPRLSSVRPLILKLLLTKVRTESVRSESVLAEYTLRDTSGGNIRLTEK